MESELGQGLTFDFLKWDRCKKQSKSQTLPPPNAITVNKRLKEEVYCTHKIKKLLEAYKL